MKKFVTLSEVRSKNAKQYYIRFKDLSKKNPDESQRISRAELIKMEYCQSMVSIKKQ